MVAERMRWSGLVGWTLMAIGGCGDPASSGTATDLAEDSAGDAVPDVVDDVDTTGGQASACPSVHPAMTPSDLHSCPTTLRGTTCSWEAPGCAPGVREPNRCTCTNDGWDCTKPFLNCLPLTEGGLLARGERPAPARRIATEACADVAAVSPDAGCTPHQFEDGTSTCATNADCGAGSVCLDTHTFGAGSVCSCHTPTCTTHEDCPDGFACKCGTLTSAATCDGWSDLSCAHLCLPATCRSDADCGDGGICAATPGECGWPTLGYACHHPDRPECLSDAECLGDVCQYDSAADAWRCVEPPICE